MLEENKFSYRALLHGKDAEWYFARGLDDITAAGSYEVRLFHDDMESLGITTADCDKEHYVVAHLFVSESAATGKQQALRVVGQTLLLTICATNAVKAFTRTCEVTNKGASWGSWVDLGAASTTDIQDGSITAQKLSSNIRQNAESPLRPLFVAAGATYSPDTGLYSLNGVNDLTENDIMISYIYKDSIYRLNISRVLQGVSIRAIYPYTGHKNVGDVFANSPINGYCTFTSTNLEILRMVLSPSLSLDMVIPVQMPTASNCKWDSTFFNCSQLREIWPIDVRKVPSFSSATFRGCTSLTELRLFGLKNSLAISDSANISKESMLYLIENANPVTAMTITLHADAYAQLVDDADVVAALEAQPLVSLVSA